MAKWRFLFAWLIAAVPLSAHHGLGTINARRDMVISGTITGVQFVNPHSWLDVEGTSDEGTTIVPYHCEMRPATGLLRAGWTPDMFVVGQSITVMASPDRVDPTRCYVATLIFPDGTRLDRYEDRPAPDTPPAVVVRPLRLPNGDPNISGAWAAEPFVMTDPKGQRGAFVRKSVAATVGPGEVPEGYSPMRGVRGYLPFVIVGVLRAAVGVPPPEIFSVLDIRPTSLGEEAARDFARRVSQTEKFCGTISILRDWALPEWSPINRITQSEDGSTITLEHGHLGTVRTIHMNMDDHPADIEPTRTGHSIGHWENDTLVVDTTGFSPGLLWRDNIHGERLHIVERFTLDSDGTALTRDWEADDPDYLIGVASRQDTVFMTEAPFDVPPCQEE